MKNVERGWTSSRLSRFLTENARYYKLNYYGRTNSSVSSRSLGSKSFSSVIVDHGSLECRKIDIHRYRERITTLNTTQPRLTKYTIQASIKIVDYDSPRLAR